MAENSIAPYHLTGKSGSIGKFLCDHLESPFFDIENVRDAENWFKNRDLKDKAFLHLAAIVGEAQVKANLDKARRVNIDGTLKLAKLALEHGVNRFLFASTSHVYKPKPEFIREEVEKFPQNTYAEMKLEAEIALYSRLLNFLYGQGISPIKGHFLFIGGGKTKTGQFLLGGVIGNSTLGTDAPHQTLGQNSQQRTRDHKRFNPHLIETSDRTCGIVGV